MPASLPEGAELVEGPGGPALALSGAWGRGRLVLHGAQLADWTPAGAEPVLWLSDASRHVPLRGGVPVSFPWFAVHPDQPDAAKHGFARSSEAWQLLEVRTGDAEATVRLRLEDTADSRASIWPHRFVLDYTITLGSSLQLTLEVTNRAAVELGFEAALHNYYAVSDAADVSITGLEGLERTGLADDPGEPDGEPVRLGPLLARGLRSGIDRIYTGAGAATLHDAGLGRDIRIEAEGSSSIVVWNPGPDGAAAISDMADEAWRGMFCIETGTVRDGAVRLAPGASHRQSARISVAPH